MPRAKKPKAAAKMRQQHQTQNKKVNAVDSKDKVPKPIEEVKKDMIDKINPQLNIEENDADVLYEEDPVATDTAKKAPLVTNTIVPPVNTNPQHLSDTAQNVSLAGHTQQLQREDPFVTNTIPSTDPYLQPLPNTAHGLPFNNYTQMMYPKVQAATTLVPSTMYVNPQRYYLQQLQMAAYQEHALSQPFASQPFEPNFNAFNQYHNKVIPWRNLYGQQMQHIFMQNLMEQQIQNELAGQNAITQQFCAQQYYTGRGRGRGRDRGKGANRRRENGPSLKETLQNFEKKINEIQNTVFYQESKKETTATAKVTVPLNPAQPDYSRTNNTGHCNTHTPCCQHHQT